MTSFKLSSAPLLMSIVVVCLSQTGFADLPSVDPVVGQLQEMFSTATPPQLADMQLGKNWKCRWFSAWKKSTLQYEREGLRFSKFDGLLSNDPADTIYLTHLFHTFVLTGHAASASSSYDYADGMFLRKTGDGDLVGEVTMPKMGSYVGADSISNPQQKAASFYGVCSLGLASARSRGDERVEPAFSLEPETKFSAEDAALWVGEFIFGAPGNFTATAPTSAAAQSAAYGEMNRRLDWHRTSCAAKGNTIFSNRIDWEKTGTSQGQYTYTLYWYGSCHYAF